MSSWSSVLPRKLECTLTATGAFLATHVILKYPKPNEIATLLVVATTINTIVRNAIQRRLNRYMHQGDQSRGNQLSELEHFQNRRISNLNNIVAVLSSTLITLIFKKAAERLQFLSFMESTALFVLVGRFAVVVELGIQIVMEKEPATGNRRGFRH